ncbi:MAG: PAS domain S-box protein [Kosmotoga sp.]|nr:MAG: PAS domain S-box protein [Kosmotoga sp.]
MNSYDEHNNSSLSKLMTSLKPHDHLCLIYENNEELFNVIVPFINSGLEKNEKCIYVIDEVFAEEVIEAFTDEGIDLSVCEKKGQISFIHEKYLYNQDRHFDPDLIIKSLINEIKKALKQGYKTFRIVGGVGQTFNEYENHDNLIEYESKLNKDIFQYYPCIAICGYNRWKTNQDIIKKAILTHPLVIEGKQIYENFYYVKPEEFLNQEKRDQEVENMLNNLKCEKQSKGELQSEKKHLDTILNSVSEAIIVTDTTGKITKMNPVAEKIIGWKFEEAKEKKLNEILSITDALTGEEAECPLKKVFKEDKGTNISRTHKLLSKDGKEYYINESVTPLKNEIKDTTGIVLILRDITEDFHMKEKLKASETKFRELFENMGNAVAVYEAVDEGNNFEFLDFNKAAEKIEKISKSDVIGKKVTEVFPEVKSFGLLDVFKRVWRTGIPEQLPITEYKDNRIEGWRRNYVYRLPSGKIVSVYEDFTELKQIEEALSHERNLLRNITETVPIGITVVDKSGRITFANQQAEKMLGLSKDEISERTYNDPTWKIKSVHGGEFPDEKLPFNQVMKTGKPIYDVEHAIEWPSGKQVLLKINAAPLFDKNENLDGMVASMENITKLKQTEEKLNKINTRLNLAYEGAKIGIWDHDFRTDKVYRMGKWSEMLGYKPGEIENEVNGWESLIHPKDIGKVKETMRKTAKGISDEFKVAHRLKCKNGKYKWILNWGKVVEFNHEGKPIRAVGVHVDIDELRKTQEALQNSMKQLTDLTENSIKALAAAVDLRDPYTAGHQRKVAELAEKIAERMELGSERVFYLKLAAMVHDAGKIQVPSEILNKPGKLSALEMEMVRSHATSGWELFKNIDFTWPLAEMIHQHHERLDGSGYPKGLKEDEILLESKILAVADVVEAMSSHRPYRQALGIDAALYELEKNAGKLYDQEVVDICLELFKKEGFKFEE